MSLLKKNGTKTKEVRVFGCIAVLLIIYIVLVGILGAPKQEIKSVEVADQTAEDGKTGQVDPILVKKELEGYPAYKDLKVFVYAKSGSPSDNINEDTLNYMRDKHPEFISGDKWADGTLILTLNIESGGDSVGSGQVGTYFGEDVKIPKIGQQQHVQSQGYDKFKENNWSQGIINVGQSASDIMAQPKYASAPVAIFYSIIIMVFVLVWSVVNNIARRAFNFSSTYLDENAQELNDYVRDADNVLVGQYAERIAESSHELLISYTDLLESRDKLMRLAWFLVGFHAITVHKFCKRSDEIVGELSLLIDAMDIYEKNPGWEQAWERQIKDTESAIRDLVFGEKMSHLDSSSKLYNVVSAEMDDIRESMYAGTQDVDVLFMRVDKINQAISDHVEKQMKYELGHESNGKKRSMIENSIQRENRKYNRIGRASLFTYYSPIMYYSPHSYATGYSSGVTSYKNHTSGSSSSGYGGSGGGFSGSGSSSSF